MRKHSGRRRAANLSFVDEWRPAMQSMGAEMRSSVRYGRIDSERPRAICASALGPPLARH